MTAPAVPSRGPVAVAEAAAEPAPPASARDPSSCRRRPVRASVVVARLLPWLSPWAAGREAGAAVAAVEPLPRSPRGPAVAARAEGAEASPETRPDGVA